MNIYIYIWINKWSSFSACIIYAIHIYIIIIILKLFSSFSVYWNIFLSQEIVSLIEWFVCSHFMFANLFISFHVDWINFHFITLGPLSLSLSLKRLWRNDGRRSMKRRPEKVLSQEAWHASKLEPSFSEKNRSEYCFCFLSFFFIVNNFFFFFFVSFFNIVLEPYIFFITLVKVSEFSDGWDWKLRLVGIHALNIYIILQKVNVKTFMSHNATH